MPVCVPIKDMRDTAKFSELVETTTGPVTVTKNGYSKFVVLRSEDYDLMVQLNKKLTISLIIYWGMVFLLPGTFLINTVASSSFFKVV